MAFVRAAAANDRSRRALQLLDMRAVQYDDKGFRRALEAINKKD